MRRRYDLGAQFSHRLDGRLSPFRSPGVIQERRAGIGARTTRMWAAGFAAMLVGVSACFESGHHRADERRTKYYCRFGFGASHLREPGVPRNSAADLPKQQQYLAKYHQLLPQDKSSDDAILAAAKKYCDPVRPAVDPPRMPPRS